MPETNNKRFQTTFSGSDINVVIYLPRAFSQVAGLKDNITIAQYESDVIENRLKSSTSELARIRAGEQGLGGLDNPQEYLDFAKRGITKDKELLSIQRETVDLLQTQFNEMNVPMFNIGTISTISYSMFREKIAVRSLGTSHAQSYTRGPRTIAGSMVFTVFNHFELDKFIDNSNNIALLDQLPPFHVMLVYANEYGHVSIMHLFYVEFGSEGQSQSIYDLTIDRTLNFYCRDLLPIKEYGNGYFQSYADMIGDKDVKDKLLLTGKTEISPEPILTFNQLIQDLGRDELSESGLNELLKRGRRSTI